MKKYFRHTPEMLDFIEAGYKKFTATELTQRFNDEYHAERTVPQMISIIGKHGFRSGRDAKQNNKIRPASDITEAEVEFLKLHYQNMPAKVLLVRYNAEFGRNASLSALRGTLHRHKIRSSRPMSFARDHTPWNKNTKGLCSGNSGSFQSHNHPKAHAIGAERQLKGRMPQIKTAEGWKYKHHLIVEQNTNAHIEKNDVVIFMDGNKSNFSPDNLQHIDRGTNTRLIQNQFHIAPIEHRPTLLNIAKIETLIQKRTL